MAQPAVVTDDVGEVGVEEVLQERAAGDGHKTKHKIEDGGPGGCVSQPANQLLDTPFTIPTDHD